MRVTSRLWLDRLYAPIFWDANTGGGSGGGASNSGGNNPPPATNNAPPATDNANAGTGGDAAGSSATQTGDAQNSGANPTGGTNGQNGSGDNNNQNGNNNNNTDGQQDGQQPPPGAQTYTPEQLTEIVTNAVNTARGRWEREQRAAQRQAQSQQAQQDGNLQAQIDLQRQEITDITTERDAAIRERDEARRDLATERRSALVARIAAKHNLPPALAERLRGDTEQELETDAQNLARVAGAPQAPPTEAGPQGNETPNQPNTQQANRQWSFNTPGGVSW